MPNNADAFWGKDLATLKGTIAVWHSQPTSTGLWIEAVANKSRRLVTVLTLDQPWPSSSMWFGPIPEVPQ